MEDSLFKYYSDIDEYNVLTKDGEREIINKIKNGDPGIETELVESHLRWVIKIAKKYQGCGLSLNDLINEGNIGLIKAAKKFDYKKNVRFINYAFYWIRESIINAINETSRTIRIPVGQYEKEKENESGLLLHTVSINEYISEDGDCMEYKDLFCIEEEEPTIGFDNQSWDVGRLSTKITEMLSVLDGREEFIIRSVFGLNEAAEELSFKEIGVILNLSSERVRKIKQMAMRKIKNELVNIY